MATTVPSFRQYLVLKLDPVATVHSLGLSGNARLLAQAEKLHCHRYVGYVHQMTHVDSQQASFQVLLLASPSSPRDSHIIPINQPLPALTSRPHIPLTHQLPWKDTFHPSFALTHVQSALHSHSTKGKSPIVELPLSQKLPLLQSLNEDLKVLPSLPHLLPKTYEEAFSLALTGSAITPCVTLSPDLSSVRELRDPIQFFEEQAAFLRLLSQYAPKIMTTSPKTSLPHPSCYKPTGYRRSSNASQKPSSPNKLRVWTSQLLRQDSTSQHLQLQRI